jgi:hypothetical protein
MLHRNDYCDNSIALGMAYTIYYADPSVECELLYVIDKDESVQKLCALIGEKYLLNFKYNTISTFPRPNLEVIFRQKINELS